MGGLRKTMATLETMGSAATRSNAMGIPSRSNANNGDGKEVPVLKDLPSSVLAVDSPCRVLPRQAAPSR